MAESYLTEKDKNVVDKSQLTPLDILVCLLLPGIGAIIGIVRMLQRKPSAIRMLVLSLIMLIILAVIYNIRN
jgi:hypothetical protein